MLLCLKIYQYQFPKRGLLSQKRKDKRSAIVLTTKPKRFGIALEFVLLKTDCFNLVKNLFSWTKYVDMISFDGADSGTKTQTFWFHSC